MNVITKISSSRKETHCNARCYNSTKHTCNCFCKGLLHGKGEAYAKLNAPRAAMYLIMSDKTNSSFIPAVELIVDMRGR